jgi:hypothetical protein
MLVVGATKKETLNIDSPLALGWPSPLPLHSDAYQDELLYQPILQEPKQQHVNMEEADKRDDDALPDMKTEEIMENDTVSLCGASLEDEHRNLLASVLHSPIKRERPYGQYDRSTNTVKDKERGVNSEANAMNGRHNIKAEAAVAKTETAEANSAPAVPSTVKCFSSLLASARRICLGGFRVSISLQRDKSDGLVLASEVSMQYKMTNVKIYCIDDSEINKQQHGERSGSFDARRAYSGNGRDDRKEERIQKEMRKLEKRESKLGELDGTDKESVRHVVELGLKTRCYIVGKSKQERTVDALVVLYLRRSRASEMRMIRDTLERCLRGSGKDLLPEEEVHSILNSCKPPTPSYSEAVVSDIGSAGTHNPHRKAASEWKQVQEGGTTADGSDGADLSMTEQEFGQQRDELEAMFDEAQRSQLHESSGVELSPLLKRIQLYDYQMSGIRWLVYQERHKRMLPFFVEMPKAANVEGAGASASEGQKRVDSGGGGWYCKITKHVKSENPHPTAGCILADDMGLGKVRALSNLSEV